MPPIFEASSSITLEEGLEQLGLNLDEGARRQLRGYLDLIVRWNRVYNLTAVRDPSAMLIQHLLDSLAIVGPLRRGPPGRQTTAAGAPVTLAETPSSLRIADIGSGAGLPGVVLAIAEPRWSVTCVDTVAKKARFIQQVAAELGLPHVRALHNRVESISATPGFDLITARAFASLSDFVSLTGHLLIPAGCWVAMKGKVPHEEIAALPPEVSVFHVEPLTVPGLHAERCLIWMRKVPS
jgi:16S rRNA (guanine527-N7)-methyltransferase